LAAKSLGNKPEPASKSKIGILVEEETLICQLSSSLGDPPDLQLSYSNFAKVVFLIEVVDVGKLSIRG
jgi:hypothetical protein